MLASDFLTTTLLLFWYSSQLMTTIAPDVQNIVSRRKRFVAFPEGSSFTVAVCHTVGVIGNPNPSLLSYGLNWGMAYDLPNTTWVLTHANGFANYPPRVTNPVVHKRRYKRDLFLELEEGVENMGYDGRDCIMRALCESKQFFTRRDKGRKGNMIQEMLKSVFSMPRRRLFTREIRDNSEIVDYDRAFRSGVFEENCATIYPNCGFSLLELALGKYSQPPTNGYVGVM